MSSQCDVHGPVAVLFIVVGVGLLLVALALVFDFKGFRTRQAERDQQQQRWLYERHLWLKPGRYPMSKWYLVAGGATFMGVVFIFGSIDGLLTC